MPKGEYERTGILTLEDLEGFIPPKDMIERACGVVIAECVQNIPCNPCVEACPVGAISMAHITDNPKVDFEKCKGCRRCLHVCPGLAIFYMAIRDGSGIVGIPYELRPLPKKGQRVELYDRGGRKVGNGKVLDVEILPQHNKTAVVLLDVGDPDNIYQVRHFKVLG